MDSLSKEFIDFCLVIATQQALFPHNTHVAAPIIKTDHQLSLTSISYPGTLSDFRGLPSHPKCIFRTGDNWRVRGGFEAQPILREARPICIHPIQDSWFGISTQIYEFLDSLDIQWSTIDPVRFAEEGGEAGPLHLWVGVIPESLSFEDAKIAAEGCKKILTDADFPDVEIAFRESVYTRSVGPQLLDYVPYQTPISQITNPFTPALGIRIAPLKTPHFEGTAALYLRENKQSNRVFVLSARHVALPPSTHQNSLYKRNKPSMHAYSMYAGDIIILGSQAYTNALRDMMGEIGRQTISIETYETEINALGEPADEEDAEITSRRQQWQSKVAKVEKTIVDANALRSNITMDWTIPDQRLLGYVCYAPPISCGIGAEQFTEDWALIDLYRNKIDWDKFQGNVVNLGTFRSYRCPISSLYSGNISAPDFILKMHPDPATRSFRFPTSGFLKIRGVVTEDGLRKPKQIDANGEACLLVCKNGKTTNLTLGRGTGLESVMRTTDEHGSKMTSREFAIYPYSRKDGSFSAPGDSGSIVVDGTGCIVGLLTGGSGSTEATDVTYITPYYWLEQRIKSVFPDSYLYPMAN